MVGVGVAVLIALSGCSLLGELLGQKTTTPQENHELQRLSAVNFKRDWPGTQSIRFTQEGNYSGAGTWAANAVVTIEGKNYQQIIGPYEDGGDPLPEPGSIAPTESMTVYYSDGTSEVIE